MRTLYTLLIFVSSVLFRMSQATPATAPPMITNVPFPEKFQVTGNLSVQWKKFKRVWENYEIASRLKLQGKEERTAHFLTSLSAEAQEIVEGLQFDSVEDSKDIDIVLRKFESFCIGETNEIYERYVFNKRDQEPNETVDAYITVLRSLAKSCNYGTLEDTLIRDRIVVGIRDNATRKRLLQESKLTLKACVDTCRAAETTSAQIKAMDRGQASGITSDVHVINRNRKKVPTVGTECKFCGKPHSFSKRELCPAWGRICTICKEYNHFAQKCPSKASKKFPQKTPQKFNRLPDYEKSQTPQRYGNQKFRGRGRYRGAGRYKNSRQAHFVESETEEDDQSESMFSVDSPESTRSKIFATMKINNQLVRCLVDSGSTTNILPYKDFTSIFQTDKLEESHVTLNMYDRSKVTPVGQKRGVCVTNPRNNRTYYVDFQVVKSGSTPILGSVVAQKMKLIKVVQENILAIDCTSVSDLVGKFPKVFKGDGHLPGKLHLEVDESVPPVKLPPRKPPLALRDKYRKELERLEKRSIIRKVTEPSDWISSTVVVSKASGKVRLCIDPKPLNKALKRNHYPLATIDDVLPELAKARLFSVADVQNGFWHVELDEESSKLTTFATPWGRYRWQRMPFGISPAPEEFQRRLNEALEGLSGISTVADDIIIWGVGDNDEEARTDHDRKLVALLNRCEEKGIVLNRDKFRLRLTEVSYVGHLITSEGLKVDPKKVEAIQKMPRPTDRSGVKRIMGMLNYLQKFAPNLSKVDAPLRELLKQDVPFQWDESYHGVCLDKIKKMLCDAPILKYFDPKEPDITLQCDASQSGLGACLMQNSQPVSYAARALTGTEENYAQIEKELLAIVFAVEKYDTYLAGVHVKVESDHKPLETIFKKSLTSAPKRLQSMLLKLQKYDIEIVYKKGAQMYLADTLSRAYPPKRPIAELEHINVYQVDRSQYEADIESVNMLTHLSLKGSTVDILKQGASSDPDYMELSTVIKSGWPDEKKNLSETVMNYFNFREELSIQDRLIFKGDRLLVPECVRQKIIAKVHNCSHQGIQSCIRRAREAVFWPKMNSDIEDYISKCETCSKYQAAQQREPMISHEIPELPWQQVGCDLFQMKDKHYLICVDYYSDFYEVDRLNVNMTSSEVINKLKAHFARYGIPNTVISDNGPPFNSKDFAIFSERYDFTHTTSSPAYAQSNGKAENAVKQAKLLMTKAIESGSDPFLGLLAAN